MRNRSSRKAKLWQRAALAGQAAGAGGAVPQGPHYAAEAVEYCAASGKVRHPSRKVAVTNLNRVARGLDVSGRDRRERGALTVYLCRAGCGGWHVGNHAPECGRAE